MQVNKIAVNPTKTTLKIKVSETDMKPLHTQAVSYFARNVKVPGFRAGHAPSHLVEKNINQKLLIDHFMDLALNKFFQAAVVQEDLRPVGQPDIQLKKFVPFSDLEFEVTLEVIGQIKLADYKNVKLAKPAVKIVAKDVEEVINQLRAQAAERKEVKRPAKDGDEVLIDFEGFDNGDKPVDGAKGKDFPLVLGSKRFIPGFEEQIVGLAIGKQKEFKITFPKDYAAAALRSKKVTFKVTAKKVNELVQAKADDKFAASIGPFKTLVDLKEDIKKQLTQERIAQADRQFENELINKITTNSTVNIPDGLVEDQIMRQETEEKRDLTYKGQTWQEHLKAEGLSEQQHRDKQRSEAELRVKAGVLLSEIADKEKIEVTPEDLEVRVQLLKGQYEDAAMHAELDKPENRQAITSQLMTEKTIAKLVNYALK